ncbi:MAG: hypothetical protein AAFR81_15165 [Chloroflexota bacterium]
MTVSGAMERTGSASFERPVLTLPIEYGPAVSGMGICRDGDNRGGYVGLQLYLPDAVEEEFVSILFPGDLSPGTYEVASGCQDTDASIIASLNTNEFSTNNVTGEIRFDFIDRELVNGALTLEFTTSDEMTISLDAAFHLIPFTPRTEHNITLTQIEDGIQLVSPEASSVAHSFGKIEEQNFVDLIFVEANQPDENHDIRVTVRIMQIERNLIAERSYDLASNSDVLVTLLMDDMEIQVTEGSIRFSRAERVWSGDLNVIFETEDGITWEGQGTFTVPIFKCDQGLANCRMAGV